MTQLADPMSERADTFEIERALEAYAEATRIVASGRVVRGLQERIRQEQERGGVSRAVVSLRAWAAVIRRPGIRWDVGGPSVRGAGATLRIPTLLALLLAALTLGAAVGGAGALLPGRLDGPSVPGPLVPGPIAPEPLRIVPAPDTIAPDDRSPNTRMMRPSPTPDGQLTVRVEALRTPVDGRRGDRRRAREQRRVRAAEDRARVRSWADRDDGCVLVSEPTDNAAQRTGQVTGSGPLAC